MQQNEFAILELIQACVGKLSIIIIIINMWE